MDKGDAPNQGRHQVLLFPSPIKAVKESLDNFVMDTHGHPLNRLRHPSAAGPWHQLLQGWHRSEVLPAAHEVLGARDLRVVPKIQKAESLSGTC